MNQNGRGKRVRDLRTGGGKYNGVTHNYRKLEHQTAQASLKTGSFLKPGRGVAGGTHPRVLGGRGKRPGESSAYDAEFSKFI